MTLILWVLQSRCVFYLYEQPGSSLLWNHPRMETFIRLCDAYRCWTWMCAFGAPSPKGTTLRSSRPGVRKLCRALPSNVNWDTEITKKSYLRNGNLSVSGGRNLKASQAYTSEFGFSTLSAWLSETTPPKPCLDDVKVPNVWGWLPKKDRWDDANLVEVMQYLTFN